MGVRQGKREKEGVISLKPIFIVLLKGKILFLLLKTHLTNDEYKCFHTNLFSNSWWTQPRCPPIYVNSVSVYIFLSQILQAIGTVPQDCPSCRSWSRIPDCYKLGDFHKPLFRLNNLLIEPLRAVYLLLSVCYDWYFKGHKWVVRWRDAHGEVHRVLHTETSISGVSRLMDAFCQPTQKLFTPLCWGFFWDSAM